MKKKKRRSARSRAGSIGGRLLAVLLGILVTGLVIDWQMRPVVENMAAYQVKVFAFRIINNAILEELEQQKVAYGDFLEISKNSSGEIVSVESNMAAVNLFKARMSKRIAAELEKKVNQSLNLPVGTLLGNQFTSGRGPKIEVKVLPTGYVQSELTHEFTSAGINQTLHQVMLKTSVHITAIIPGYTISTETGTNFCIAETLIIGKIPDSFTQIQLDRAPVFSKIEGEAAVE